jgi:HrpA-like RNA helicase
MPNTAAKPFLPVSLKNLPVAEKLQEIIEVYQSNDIIVLESGTGSGKTVVTPAVISETFGSTQNKVLVTENRRILCSTTAEFLSKEMGYEVGTVVGYSFKGERRFSKNTILHFCTTGKLLQRVISGGELSLNDVGCVIVDEIHEGTVEQHILLSYLKKILTGRLANKHFKLVLMSATLGAHDKKRMAEFFKDFNIGFVSAQGRTYPVERKFSGHHLDTVAPYAWEKRLKDAIVQTVVKAHDEITDGTVLCFVPGKKEILDVSSSLKALGIDSVPLHGNSSNAEKHEAVEPVVNGKKVVLSTDVARSGITIKGVTAVVSSGYTRVLQSDSVKYTGLQTVLTDAASLKQEGGRTGRTCPGVHFIVGMENTKRPSHVHPLIQTSNISTYILQMMETNTKLHEFDWYVSPGAKRTQAILEYLHELGAIEGSEGFGITDLGKQLLQVSELGLELGKFLIHCKKYGVVKEGAVIASLLLNKVNPLPRWSKRQHTVEGDLLHIQTKYSNDLEAAVTEYEAGYFESKEFLNSQNAKDIQGTIAQCLAAVESIQIDVERVEDRFTALKQAAAMSFGHNAGAFVTEEMVCDPNGLYDYDRFYTGAAYDAVTFDVKKDSRYSEGYGYRRGLILVPLSLFQHNDNLASSFNLHVSMEELKKWHPRQAETLECFGDYKPQHFESSITRELTLRERLAAIVFAS